MTGEEIRARLDEALFAAGELDPSDRLDTLDALVAVVTEVQAAGLTADERRGLAAVFGYELGVDEGAVEIRNLRTMLADAGVPLVDGRGRELTTIRAVEGLLPRTRAADGSLDPARAREHRRRAGGG